MSNRNQTCTTVNEQRGSNQQQTVTGKSKNQPQERESKIQRVLAYATMK